MPKTRPIARRDIAGAVAAFGLLAPTAARAQAPLQADPLPSWQDGAPRRALVDFVDATTVPGSPDFIAPAERIAVFDNDGTLWCEIPTVTLVFALDRIRQLAPQHPDWAGRQPFKAVLEGDAAGLAALGERGLVELLLAAHAGNTADEFAAIVQGWIMTARHPKFGRAYTQMVYQPMLEVLRYLRANGFKIFIVSGGGAEFMRAWSDRVYGVPPEQVIGSTIKTEFRLPDNGPAKLYRLPVVDFVDDGAGKPEAIGKFIGRRPVMAFGNSDGDLQMLQYATTGPGRRFGLLVHHDDAGREEAYDRTSRFGKLDRALDLAPGAGWQVVSMRNDWRTVFPG